MQSVAADEEERQRVLAAEENAEEKAENEAQAQALEQIAQMERDQEAARQLQKDMEAEEVAQVCLVLLFLEDLAAYTYVCMYVCMKLH